MTNLNNYPTIKKELASYILDRINDGVINNENRDEWHFHCFNEDYYIIGYYQASEWLKTHDLDTFEAIEMVKEYEMDHFGEFNTKINSEAIVNMLVYILGEELIYSDDFKNIKQLKKAMKEIAND
jgi:hypothetical protein